MPVNKNALEESAGLKIDMLSQMRKQEGMPAYGDTNVLAQIYADKIKSWTESIQHYSYFEPIITDIIFQEGQYFFLENKSAQDVAHAMNNKVSLYLNE